MNILSLIPGQYKRVGGKNGGEYAGGCPWCGDGGKGHGSDRFHIWPEQGSHGTYWCRMCGKAGDAIKYLIDHDGMAFKEACQRLDLDPAILMPKTGKVPSGWQAKEATRPADIWADHARKFVDWCHERLLERPIEMEWLAERGIGQEMVEKYRLGWNPAHAWREGSAWGVTMERKADGKLKKLWLPRGLVIPLIERDGQVHRLRVRQPDQSPRYMVIQGSGREPLCSRDAEAMFVFESELDAILLDGLAGDIVGVVAMGNDTAKPTASLLPTLQQSLFIGVSLDSDQPKYNPETGRMDMPGAKASRWWLEQFDQAVRVPMVGGKDPGDAFKAGVDLRTWVLASLPPYFQVKADLEKAKSARREQLQVAAGQEITRHQENLDERNEPETGTNEPNLSQIEPNLSQIEPKNKPNLPDCEPMATGPTLITLKNGQSFYVTANREEWQRLSDAGEVVFSEHEMARLQAACAKMNPEERLAAAMLALEVKQTFPSAWIGRGVVVE